MALSTAAALTLAQARTQMAVLMQDEGNSFWTAAQKTTALQYWQQRWHERFYNRLDRMGGTTLFAELANGTKSIVSADATIMVYRHVHIEVGGSGSICIGAELEQLPPHEVRRLQIIDAAVSTPRCIGFEREAANTNSDTVGFWRAWFYPIPSGAFQISGLVKKTPYVPVADGDFFDMSPYECQIVVTLAALQGAFLAGRDSEYLNALNSSLPDDVRAVLTKELLAGITPAQAGAGAPVT